MVHFVAVKRLPDVHSSISRSDSGLTAYILLLYIAGGCEREDWYELRDVNKQCAETSGLSMQIRDLASKKIVFCIILL